MVGIIKSKLYIFTLEPIEKRYTKQWFEYWINEFPKYYDEVEYINGTLGSDKIEKGKFLDINKTNIWKAEQVIQVAWKFQKDEIKDGDTFIFCDGWCFGITALKYMAQLNDINIKIYTYLHAGTWDEYDFISQAGLRDWAKHNELGWLKACDGHFVATLFHKRLILDYFGKEQFKSKIHVVGFPMDWDKVIEDCKVKSKVNRKKLVVFPHRIDKEKCPEVFDRLSLVLPKYEFVKTMNVTKNKKEYYELISEAKVIFSANKQETFGIGSVEAICLGCIPVVPNKLSYVELYDRIFRYNNLSEAKEMIKNFMNNYDWKDKVKKALDKDIKNIKENSRNSIRKMADIMLRRRLYKDE